MGTTCGRGHRRTAMPIRPSLGAAQCCIGTGPLTSTSWSRASWAAASARQYSPAQPMVATSTWPGLSPPGLGCRPGRGIIPVHVEVYRGWGSGLIPQSRLRYNHNGPSGLPRPRAVAIMPRPCVGNLSRCLAS
jgi:hypothetical protein